MTRLTPTPNTVKRLFALSRNQCAFLDCDEVLVDSDGNLVGQICHIEAAEEGGQRYNPNQSDDERRSFENLILLCTKHHIVTNDVEKYTVEVLKEMKKRHEEKSHGIPNKSSEIARVIENVLRQYFKNFQPASSVEDSNALASHNLDEFNSNVENFDYPTPQYFIGRQNVVNELFDVIQKRGILVICGIPGIGKTALTATLANKLENKHQVLWLDCEIYSSYEQVVLRIATFIHQKFGDRSLINFLKENPTASPRVQAEKSVNLLTNYECLLVCDQFNQSKHSSLLLLLEAGSKLSEKFKLIIAARERLTVSNLLNRPYVYMVLKLDIEPSLALMRHYLSLSKIDEDEDILIQAYHRVEGHPYFMILLTTLAESFPLANLLNEIPYFTNEAFEYIKQKIFENLTASSKDLLRYLSIIRIPFQVSAVGHLKNCPDNYLAFDELVRMSVVNRQNTSSKYYEIHSIIKDYCIQQISEEQLVYIHKCIVNYYESLPEKLIIYALELTHHALEARDSVKALISAKQILGFALHDGLYNLVLDFTANLLTNNTAKEWFSTRFSRGRAFRFKNRIREAANEYRVAVSLAETIEDRDKAKFELANVLIKLFWNSKENTVKEAKEIYSQLIESEDLSIKVAALAVLGKLEAYNGMIREGLLKVKNSLKMAEEANLEREIVEACSYLGIIYGHKLVNYKKAIEYLEKSRELLDSSFSKGNDIETKYNTLLYLALFYKKVNRHANALVAITTCVNIDRELELSERLAHALYHQGHILCLLKLFNQAKDILSESLEINRRLNNYSGEAAVHAWLAVTLWYLSEFEIAIEHYLEHLYICRRQRMFAHQFIFISTSDLISGIDPLEQPEAAESSVHMLSLNELGYLIPTHLSRWIENVIRRRPELSGIANSIEIFQKKETTSQNSKIKSSRNKLCPCGSEKKYKLCCGRIKKRGFNL